jgi:glycosyltransferase involved in cell wall biosynthesis
MIPTRASEPEISCVVPTHESVDLVARCLTSVAAQREAILEIIVADDSPTAAIENLVGALPALAGRVRYMPGARSGNPVDNWNLGLARAQAPLHLLIHQDEHLLDPLYLRRAVDALRRTGAAAARAGTKVTGVARPSRFALVAPIAGRLPGARGLLPAINWIGPTAAFVFRAGWRFDPQLVQLVDVEFYGRVLASGPMVRLPGISVGSLGHHEGQITARIDDPAALALKELDLLASRTPPAVSPTARRMLSALIRARSRMR